MRKPNTTCFNCKSPCYVRPGQMERQSTWFCSRDCQSSFLKAQYSAVCEYCSEKFKSRDSGQKFCSRSCSNRARTGIRYGQGRPNCNIQRGQRQRTELIERDGNRCSNSECPSPEPMWAGKPLTLQIEHIDGNRKNNDLSNLVLLCPNCHTQTDTWSKPKSFFTQENC